MVNINIISIVAFLVLACLLAGLVALARARRKALPPGGFPVENSHPGGQGFRLGGVAGVGPGALAAATTAAAAATSAAVSAFDRLAAAAPSEPAALATAATAAAAAAAAAVPVFNGLADVATAEVAATSTPVAAAAATAAAATAAVPAFDGLVAIAPPAVTPQLPVVADVGEHPGDVMFGINPYWQAFNLVGRAGHGGVKMVNYIDKMEGDWVLAIPMDKYKARWREMVDRELKMASELRKLGIPCLDMYGVMYTAPVVGEYYGIALKMRSFDYYQKTHKMVIYDRKNPRPIEAMKAMIKGRIDTWLAHGSVSYATDQLCKFLAPLVDDIKKVAQNCRDLSTDSFNWQIVYSDDELQNPLHVRIFIFDLGDLDIGNDSILAEGGESASIKNERALRYVEIYLNALFPFIPFSGDDTPEEKVYNGELYDNTLARLRERVLA